MPGVELVGHLGSAVGVGEAARRYVSALRSAGVPVLERDVPLPQRDTIPAGSPAGVEPSAGHPSIAHPAGEAVAFNLLCLNPQQMVPYLQGPEAPPRDGRATIAIWSWEVDVLPSDWREASAGVDEVWTYSRFAAELIGAGLGRPVGGFPPPLASSYGGDRAHGRDPAPGPAWSKNASDSGPTAGGAMFELPAGFRVLIMFDYLSTLERKNPLGAIEAYRRAFAPGDGAVLVVKSVNARHRPERQAEVTAAVASRADIAQIDQTISPTERDALIGSCDCYLSLHRSEGHGMPLAEAMALGKPVVATAYGGNTEFMREANSYLVKWTPTLVGAAVEHYPAAASWAEPDIEHAALVLRAVQRDPDEMRRRAARGQADVQALLAPAAVGAQMCGRLQELHDRRGSRTYTAQ
jgi:glycosyltransferase involved in cell wall biosynthesis